MAAPQPKSKTIAENRRARFDYFLEDNTEAGLVLTGTEITHEGLYVNQHAHWRRFLLVSS